MYNMKTLTILILAMAFQAAGQTKEPFQPRFMYCELVGTQKLLSQKITITIDFGESKRL